MNSETYIITNTGIKQNKGLNGDMKPEHKKIQIGPLTGSQISRKEKFVTRVLQKVLSLGSDYFSATFYQTYFYNKPSKYPPFTETHFCNLFTQSRKADK